MSLIQEALKRQQEEMDDGAGTANSTRPNTPPPSPQETPRIARKIPVSSAPIQENSEPPPIQLPDQLDSSEQKSSGSGLDERPEDENAGSIPPAPKDSSKAGLKVLGIIIGVVVFLILGVWAIIFAFQTWSKSGQTATAEIPPDTKTVESTPQSADDTTAHAVVDVPPVVEPGAPVGGNTAVPEAAPEPVVPEPVVWPMLTINGLVGKGAQGAAMINAQIIGVNETIEGVKVIDIQKQGVTLEFEGEKRFVKVGGSTE